MKGERVEGRRSGREKEWKSEKVEKSRRVGEQRWKKEEWRENE